MVGKLLGVTGASDATHIPLHKTLIKLKTSPEIKKWLLKPSNCIATLFLQYPTIGKLLVPVLVVLCIFKGFNRRTRRNNYGHIHRRTHTKV